MQQIKVSLSQIDWQRYQQLIKKRYAETLTPVEQVEQKELIAFSDRLEVINIDRLGSLVKLAQIRSPTVFIYSPPPN